MKRSLILTLFYIAVSAFSLMARPLSAAIDPPQIMAGIIIVMVDDILGMTLENPEQNAMVGVRIVNSGGEIVFQKNNIDPVAEYINVSGVEPGTYQVQVKLLVGWDAQTVQIQ